MSHLITECHLRDGADTSSPSRDGADILNAFYCYNTKNLMLLKINTTQLKSLPNN